VKGSHSSAVNPMSAWSGPVRLLFFLFAASIYLMVSSPGPAAAKPATPGGLPGWAMKLPPRHPMNFFTVPSATVLSRLQQEKKTRPHHNGPNPTLEQNPEYGNPPLINPGSGPIQTTPNLFLIFWGSNWLTEANKPLRTELEHFYEGLTSKGTLSEWSGILSQYCGSNGCPVVNGATISGIWVDPEHLHPTNVCDAKPLPNYNCTGTSVTGEVSRAVHLEGSGWSGQGANSNAQFIVLPAPFTTYAAGWAGFCGYHGTFESATYTFVPAFADAPFSVCASAYTETGAASHEYAETVTDPHVDTGPVSWLSNGGQHLGEVADMCATTDDLYHNTGISVQGLWDDNLNGCALYDANPPRVHPIDSEPLASNIEAHAATLRAVVNPMGTRTHVYFEYGITPYTNSTAGEPQDAGSIVGAVNMSKSVSGLQPATTYHFRSVAYNDWSGPIPGPDSTFTTPAAPPVVTIEVPTISGPGSAVLHGTVNPEGAATHYRLEWRKIGGENHLVEGEAGSGVTPKAIEQAMTGLVGHTTYSYSLFATNSVGSAERIGEFVTPEWKPIATTEGATEVKARTATLHASVNPNGFDTHYRFEYDTKKYQSGEGSHGTSVPAAPGDDVGAGTTAVSVGKAISNLAVGTTYHFRVVAESINGTTYGTDKEFETAGLPVVTPETPRYLNTFEPELRAAVNPHGADTHYWFEYGTTVSYGTKVPANEVGEDIGSGRVAVGVGKAVKGLSHAQVYHFRVVASNEAGSTTSGDSSFETLPACNNGTETCTWSPQATPNPVAKTEAQLEGVSCASATMCIGVGNDNYTGRGIAEAWNGSEWKTISTSFYGSQVKAVSCASTTWCMAIGKSGAAAWRLKYVEVLPGLFTWEVSGTFNMQTPAGSTLPILKGISCSSTSACTAVGYYQAEGGEYKSLVERWNGTEWSPQTAPNPAEGTATQAMQSVSCDSATSCTTVGTAANKPTAEHWNGSSWSPITPANPTGATVATLEGVSCTSSTSCLAAGSYNLSGGYRKTLVERWSGSSWTVLASPNPSGAEGARLQAISCLSSTSCLAVGRYVSKGNETVPAEERTLAESLNGGEWGLVSSSNSAGATYNTLAGVSCTSSIACTAVGSANPGPSGEAKVTLGERYE
jgi:hypothetical protein